jgi:hypothetical protein
VCSWHEFTQELVILLLLPLLLLLLARQWPAAAAGLAKVSVVAWHALPRKLRVAAAQTAAYTAATVEAGGQAAHAATARLG